MRMDDRTVTIGCDVGKTHHQVEVIDAGFERVGRRRLPNTFVDVDAMLEWAQGLGERAVLVIDQKASCAAVLRYCAAVRDIPVLYVTGLQARRAADLTPGKAKTDKIDARVIAEFGRTHAHRLPRLEQPSELEATLRLWLGHDEDLRCDFNRTINRLRDLLCHYAPELEAALGRRLLALGVLAVFTRWANPNALARARHATITGAIAVHNPRLAGPVAKLMRDNAKHAPTQPGLDTAGELIATLATRAIELAQARAAIAGRLAEQAAQHADYELLNTIPGMGPKTTTRFIAEIGDITNFPSGDQLASYAGLAPVNRQSGNALNTVHKDRAGNHRLKNSLFLAAFVASRHDPQAARCYQTQRSRGKHHNAAVICVARKRCNIIWAVLTNRTPYNPDHEPRKHENKPLTK